jgi:serine/threonine protein kinase
MTNSFFCEIGKSIKTENAWYRNIQLLGTGGNAVTFLVMATSTDYLGNLFALKVFRKLSNKSRREKFLQEIDFLKQCNHPSIMRVYDAGEYEDKDKNLFPFVVADYLPYTLRDIIHSGRASISEKLAYTLQLLSALVYLNELKPSVIHRDIKPQNIFVKGNSCVLGDFGLMKRVNKNNEIDRDIFKESIGPRMPFYYRTPDLVSYTKNGTEITTKSDIFQLGLVVAELFTGQNPLKKCKDHLDPVILNALQPVPGGLGEKIYNAIKIMLKQNPDYRPNVKTLISRWQRIFEEAVNQSHILNGKVF